MIIHRSFALVGGAERVIIEKANYLCEHGHEVFLVSYEQGYHEVPYHLHESVAYRDLDCRFFTLSKYSPLLRLFYFFKLKSKLKASLKKEISDYSPSVVVLASDWQFLIKIVLEASQRIPVIAEFHNAYDFITKKIGDVENGIKAKITRWYYCRSLKYFRKCARLVVLTENDAKRWRKHSDKVTVIPNPVSYYPEVTNDVSKVKGKILCVGRYNGQKRIDRLITAFSMIAKKYPDWFVDIYGEGDLRDFLQNQIDSLGLTDRIILHNPVKTIFDEYKSSQMLVLSSEYEGRPLVLIEAMACGTPCVSFDCPSGPSEIIEDGVTGLLAENGNVNDLASKIEWLINHEKEREVMGVRSHEAAKIYKPLYVMKEWEKLYVGLPGYKS